jgi:hypothetical protein
MKAYPTIPGPSKSPQGPCIAFYKYDGSNLRFEWTKKRGWWKFGTRKRLFDANDPEYGGAIQLFQDTYADGLAKVFHDNKNYRGVETVTVFCEWFGVSSFAGYHDWQEPHEVMLIDVEVYKRGIVLPSDFVKDFGHLKIAEVVYRGNFGPQFVQDVKEGKYKVAEGVVAKGVILGKKKSPQHGLWMSKVKTLWWLNELKRRAQTDAAFRQALMENLSEQG